MCNIIYVLVSNGLFTRPIIMCEKYPTLSGGETFLQVTNEHFQMAAGRDSAVVQNQKQQGIATAGDAV